MLKSGGDCVAKCGGSKVGEEAVRKASDDGLFRPLGWKVRGLLAEESSDAN